MLQTALLIVIFFLAVGGFAAILFMLKNRDKNKSPDSLLLIQNQLSELSRTIDGKLTETSRATQFQLGESAKIIKEITQELAKVGEGQRQVVSVADQLKGLQDILKNPKQRGVLGEYYLETVLKNVLPPGSYAMQYAFRDGDIVDAVVITKEGIIPVDSKFSLENYNRFLEAKTEEERARFENAFYYDLKTRVDETAKYVRPEEGTLGFAFMFIPSEAVYYDLLINKIGSTKSNAVNLIEYAAGKKKVMVVSPTTFLAYLQTILQGLKALQIEEAAQKIGDRVNELSRHLLSFDGFMQKLGAHLGTTVGMYNNAHKEFRKIDKDILKIAGNAMGIEPHALDKPEAIEE